MTGSNFPPFVKQRTCPASPYLRSPRLSRYQSYAIIGTLLLVTVISLNHWGCVMSDNQSTASFLSGLNPGSDSAANEVDRLYRQRLCALVQREMGRSLRVRRDPEDVVQTVFRTFFRRAAKGEFHIECSTDLWALLAAIARRKILKLVEYDDASKRRPKAERPLADGDQLAGREPDAQDVAITAELIEKTLAGLDSSYGEVFEMRLQGCTLAEIAANLGLTFNAVRWRLERIEKNLMPLIDPDFVK